MTHTQADLPHDVTEQELQKIGKHLNFSEACFTSAKDFCRLESQIRRFAETVKDQSYSGERGGGGLAAAQDPDTVVLESITRGSTSCAC